KNKKIITPFADQGDYFYVLLFHKIILLIKSFSYSLSSFRHNITRFRKFKSHPITDNGRMAWNSTSDILTLLIEVGLVYLQAFFVLLLVRAPLLPYLDT